MISGIHFLLTYRCTFECEHCFLYCSPHSPGTFTINQIQKTLDEAEKMNTIDWIFFEGGEPLLYYPLLLEGIRRAKNLGFKVGLVTNAYPLQTPEDAILWLEPFKTLEIDSLSISIDEYHYDNIDENPGQIAYETALKLQLPVQTIEIKQPKSSRESDDNSRKGQPIVDGGPQFRGRAADFLACKTQLKSPESYTECPYEELVSPNRVHVDAFGSVHICQGILIGNMWKEPLSELIQGYNVKTHPVCSPLHKGGPLELAKAMEVTPDEGYADACHFCFSVRRQKLAILEGYLGPAQVYGQKSED